MQTVILKPLTSYREDSSIRTLTEDRHYVNAYIRVLLRVEQVRHSATLLFPPSLGQDEGRSLGCFLREQIYEEDTQPGAFASFRPQRNKYVSHLKVRAEGRRIAGEYNQSA